MSDHSSDETIMTSAPTNCTAAAQVVDLALLDISSMQKIYPCRRSPELRLTWEMFAGRELSDRQLDELCALKFALSKSGYAKFGPVEYQREFNVKTLKTAQHRFNALLRLTTEIGLAEPWDFRTNRKKPRFLRLTQHAITFQWAELLDQFKQTLTHQHKDERDGDLDARDLRIWLSEQRASKSRKPGAVVPETGSVIPDVGSVVPETGSSPAEIPCNNRAGSPLNKRLNNCLDKGINKRHLETAADEQAVVVPQPVAEQRDSVPTAEQPTAITANSQIEGTANSQPDDNWEGSYSEQMWGLFQLKTAIEFRKKWSFVEQPTRLKLGTMLWSVEHGQVGTVVMGKPGASQPLAFEGMNFGPVLDEAALETMWESDSVEFLFDGSTVEPAHFELDTNRSGECADEDVMTIQSALSCYHGQMPRQLEEYLKQEHPERYQKLMQERMELDCVDQSAMATA